MSKRMIALLLLIFIGPLLFYLLWPSDESRIRKLFKKGAKAIQEEKPEEVMAAVSFNYTDEHGLSYLFLKEGTTRFFAQADNIKVDYVITGIDIKKETAAVAVEVKVAAGLPGEKGRGPAYIAGDAAKPVQMKFHLEKERSTWLVIRTEGLPVWH
ncbi:MAG: hypothetical protein C0402_01650 [Thermodesulfovibrio sp.]|nr:hypothetical protein [Thermodesulfovibrio sp.]